jgi:ribokinase
MEQKDLPKKLNFLAIGDCVCEPFIELDPKFTHTQNEKIGTELCMQFGDKIPYLSSVELFGVGNSPNAAVSASRLGLRSGVLTHIGDDKNGNLCLENFAKENLDTDFVISHRNIATNYHFVLRFGAERTILVKHNDFPYNLAAELHEKEVPDWIYFSSVGENSLTYHDEIADYVANNKVKLAFQPGTYQIKLGFERLKRLYESCEVFFCNIEEAKRILNIGINTEIKELLQKIHDLGPNIVCITDGPNGAYLYYDTKFYVMPIYPDPKPPVERTGAGDSFASTFTAALSLGKSPLEAMIWAPINSMNVVQEIGAQKGLLSRETLETYLKNAPKHYKLTEI